jgi:hypothetical protein
MAHSSLMSGLGVKPAPNARALRICRTDIPACLPFGPSLFEST